MKIPSQDPIPQDPQPKPRPQDPPQFRTATYRARWEQDQQRDREFASVLDAAAQADPAVEAERQQIARQLGKRPEEIPNDLEVARGVLRKRAADYYELSRRYPGTFERMQDVNFVRMAKDDVGNLKTHEGTLDWLARNFEAGDLANERGWIGLRRALGKGDQTDDSRLLEVDQLMRESAHEKGFVADATQILGQMAGTMPVAMGIGAGTSALAGPGAPLAFPIASGAATFTLSGAIQMGNAYLDMRERGIPHEIAYQSAILSGAAEGSLETLSQLVGLGPFRGAIGKFAARAGATTLAKETAGKAMGRFVVAYAKTYGAELGTELTQTLASNLIEQRAAAQANAAAPGTVKPGTPLGAELADTLEKVGKGMALLSLPGPGLELLSGMRKAQRSAAQVRALEDLAQAGERSQMKKLAPDEYAKTINVQGQKAGVGTVYVDAGDFQEALRQADKAEVSEIAAKSGLGEEAAAQIAPKASAELARKIPAVFESLRHSAVDVAIPIGDYQAHIEGTQFGDMLRPHRRFDRDGFSPAEAEQFAKETRQMLLDKMDEQQTVAEARAKAEARIRDAKFAEIKAAAKQAGANIPDAEARAGAEIHAAMVSSLAERTGMQPEEFAAKYPLRVASMQQATKGALAQGATDSPEFRAWFGDSKVVDESGKPLVVYHGTAQSFDAFNVRGLGAWFTNRPEIASSYSEIATRLGGSPQVVPAHLSIRNPAPSEAIFLAYQEAKNSGKKGAADAQAFVRDRLVREGYDGIVDGKGVDASYVAFRPEQIKSVNNRGTYDPNDPNILRQDGEEGSRAEFRGNVAARNLTTALGRKADASSFVHESAHYYLTILSDLASSPDPSPALLHDMQTLLDWFGVKDLVKWNEMSLDQQRKHHEAFAASFELYLSEGQAPSVELQGVFDRFRVWLMRIYHAVRLKLNAAHRAEFGEDLPILTDEVRNVFDRMLASDEQVRQAQAIRSVTPLFQTQKEAGMTDAEWLAYQEMHREQVDQAMTDRARDTLKATNWVFARTKELQRENKKANDAARERLRDGVAREVQQRPVYRAHRWLRKGEYLANDGTVEKETGAHKLSRDAVRRMLGLEVGFDERDAQFDEPAPPPKAKAPKRAKSMVTRIRELGGISWASWERSFPGERYGEFRIKGVVRGKKGGGMPWDQMAARLASEGYSPNTAEDVANVSGLGTAENRDDSWFIEAIQNAANGVQTFPREAMGEGAGLGPEPDTRAPATPEELAAQAQAQADDDAERAAIQSLGAPIPTKDPGKTIRKLRGLLGDDEAALPPDLVAEMFFGEGVTGEQMVREFLQAAPMREAIDTALDERMLAEHPELSDPKAIQRSIAAAISNDARSRFVAAELRAATKATQPVRVMLAAAKEAARQQLAAMPVGEIDPRTFAVQESRAAVAARKALAAGDIAAQIAAQRKQLVANQMVRLAADAREEVDKARRGFERVFGDDEQTAKRRNMDVVQAARAVLGEHGIGPAARVEKATAYLARVRTYDPELHAELAPLVEEATATAQPWEQMPLEAFRVMQNTVEALWYRAKRSNEIEVDGRKVLRKDAVAQMVEAMRKQLGDAPVRRSATSETERESTLWAGALAKLRRVEHWAVRMDGGKAHGPVWTYLFRPVRERYDSYMAARETLVSQLLGELKKVGDLSTEKIDGGAELNGFVFANQAELLGALLHSGNESNLRKLLLGYDMVPQQDDGTIDTSPWWSFVDRMVREGKLTRAHFEFAQAVWDINNDTLKPQAQKVNRSVYGQYFEEIPAQPFRVQFGGESVEFKGGYMPAKPDPLRNPDLRVREGLDGIMDGERNMRAALTPATSRGFTKARTEVTRPLVLDVKLATQHIDEVLRFVHMQPAVRDVVSLLRDRDFAGYLNSVDPTAIKSMLIPWLADTADNRVQKGGDGMLDRFLTTLRRNTGLAFMFGSVRNALQQAAGVGNASVYVQGKYLRSALWKHAQAPRETAEHVAGLSRFMNLRLESQIGQLHDDIGQILDTSVRGKVQAWTNKHGYFLQRAVQNRVDIVTWMGAFDQAMAGRGDEDAVAVKKAVAEADSIVRRSQGSTTPADTAAYERGTALSRAFTQFSGYWNLVLNQILGEAPGSARAKAALRAFIIPTLAASAIAGAVAAAGGDGLNDWKDDYDQYSGWQIAKTFGIDLVRGGAGMAPAIGPLLAQALTKQSKDRIAAAPMFSFFETARRVVRAPLEDDPQNFAAKEKRDARRARDVVTFFAMATGLPVGPLATPAAWLVDDR